MFLLTASRGKHLLALNSDHPHQNAAMCQYGWRLRTYEQVVMVDLRQQVYRMVKSRGETLRDGEQTDLLHNKLTGLDSSQRTGSGEVSRPDGT